MRQLLDNLLENSLRYTDRGGHIVVCMNAQDHSVRVLIDDSAPGVAEDVLDHLFEPLYRAETSRNRQTGGSGLGLAIARRIALAHEGSLRALPSPLGGVRIELTLPQEDSLGAR